MQGRECTSLGHSGSPYSVTSSLVYGSAHLIAYPRPRSFGAKRARQQTSVGFAAVRRYIAPDVTPLTPLSVTVPRTGTPASQGRTMCATSKARGAPKVRYARQLVLSDRGWGQAAGRSHRSGVRSVVPG